MLNSTCTSYSLRTILSTSFSSRTTSSSGKKIQYKTATSTKGAGRFIARIESWDTAPWSLRYIARMLLEVAFSGRDNQAA